MTLTVILTGMMLFVVLNNMIHSPMCGYCGKRLVHAKDCRQRRDDD